MKSVSSESRMGCHWDLIDEPMSRQVAMNGNKESVACFLKISAKEKLCSSDRGSLLWHDPARCLCPSLPGLLA